LEKLFHICEKISKTLIVLFLKTYFLAFARVRVTFIEVKEALLSIKGNLLKSKAFIININSSVKTKKKCSKKFKLYSSDLTKLGSKGFLKV